jgi:hypothetical protein
VTFVAPRAEGAREKTQKASCSLTKELLDGGAQSGGEAPAALGELVAMSVGDFSMIP